MKSDTDELARLRAENERLRNELEQTRFRPMGDNHHNAAACPHCRPALEKDATDLAEWQRNAAAYDAGVRGFGVLADGLRVFASRSRTAAATRADACSPPGYVVPVRIVEELK